MGTLNEQCDFDRALELLADDIIRIRCIERPKTFDWYYNDHLYTNVRFVAVIEGDIVSPKWQYPYAFWVLSTGPILQARHFFRLRYWNGFYVVFDNMSVPFESDFSFQIEEMLREDDGLRTPMKIVRDICEETGVLITPRFVTLSRQARTTAFSYGLMNYPFLQENAIITSE